MLRIDETSKTLVAPEPAAMVVEPAPAGDEVLALLSAGWQAFAHEIHPPHLVFVVAATAPGSTCSPSTRAPAAWRSSRS